MGDCIQRLLVYLACPKVPKSQGPKVPRFQGHKTTANVNKRNKMLTYSHEASNNQNERTKQNANMTNKTITTANVNKRNKMLTYSHAASNNQNEQTKQNANMTNKTITGHEHNRLLSERSLMKPSITLLMSSHVHDGLQSKAV
jgi:hypothetical protein